MNTGKSKNPGTRGKALRTMTVCAMFAALICICSPVSVPVGAVPVSLSLLAVFITAVVAGAEKGVISCAVFILLGAVGLPVFSVFCGGVSVLAGPTGGFILSYIPAVFVTGLLAAKCRGSRYALLLTMLSCLPGLAICYALGTLQFMLVTQSNAGYALSVCVLPFLGFDPVKIAAAAAVGLPVRHALEKAGFPVSAAK